MANIKSFPNNQDEYVGAEYVMRWLHGRSSGVFGADGNAAVAPVLDAMAVTVSDGNGWISNDNADGVVWWIDNESVNGSKLQLSIDMADAVLPRIDRVIVSWQTTNYVAYPEVSILKGIAASNPVAPALTNNNILRQISLAAIRIPAGVTSITADMITDERLNSDVCGIVTDRVSVDTSMVNSQMLALLEQIRKNLTEVTSGTIPSGSVTRAKLATDALYSPIATLSGGNLTTNHIGKTVRGGWNASVTYTMTQENSSAIDVGSEIAIYNHSQNGENVTVASDGVRFAISGDGTLKANISVKIVDPFGMIALKKIEAHASYGDMWLVTGNVEVV